MTGLESKLRTLPEDIMGEARNLFVIQKSKRATMQHMGEVFALRDQLNLRSSLGLRVEGWGLRVEGFGFRGPAQPQI
jgi:hypothetical protein